MKSSDQNYFGIRLKLARKMAGMSLQDLSDGLESIVTKQSLNKYEQGLMNPTNDVLLAISKALNVKPDYFLKQNPIEFGEISFRKKVGLTKKIEESITEKVRDYIERFHEIENILGLKSEFKNPLVDIKITCKEDIESAASKLRDSWELGFNPITNLINLLELKGVRVIIIENVDQIDGLSVLTLTGIPVILINTNNKNIERIRFTVIHELAHLILSFDDHIKSNVKLIEKLCHYFSSCFLLPSKMLISMIGGKSRNYITINELITIKEYFGISIRAILHRLQEIGVITQNYYQRWVIYISKTYGYKEEPGNFPEGAKCIVFEHLINRALSEGLISLSKASVLLNKDINELRKAFINVP